MKAPQQGRGEVREQGQRRGVPYRSQPGECTSFPCLDALGIGRRLYLETSVGRAEAARDKVDETSALSLSARLEETGEEMYRQSADSEIPLHQYSSVPPPLLLVVCSPIPGVAEPRLCSARPTRGRRVASGRDA